MRLWHGLTVIYTITSIDSYYSEVRAQLLFY